MYLLLPDILLKNKVVCLKKDKLPLSESLKMIFGGHLIYN